MEKRRIRMAVNTNQDVTPNEELEELKKLSLDASMSLIKKHYSWADWHDGANPIVQRIQKNGWNFGKFAIEK